MPSSPVAEPSRRMKDLDQAKVSVRPSGRSKSGAPPDVVISTGNGDDDVIVHPATDVFPTTRDLLIDTGNGDDDVVLTFSGNAPFAGRNVDVSRRRGQVISLRGHRGSWVPCQAAIV